MSQRRSISRRNWLRATGIAIFAVPACALTRQALASTNAELRAKLQYQDSPKDGFTCTACLEFLPGKDTHAAGGCKVIPGDDEISPDGWCSAWNSL